MKKSDRFNLSPEGEKVMRELAKAIGAGGAKRRARARQWRIDDTWEIRDHLVRNIEDEWEGI